MSLIVYTTSKFNIVYVKYFSSRIFVGKGVDRFWDDLTDASAEPSTLAVVDAQAQQMSG